MMHLNSGNLELICKIMNCRRACTSACMKLTSSNGFELCLEDNYVGVKVVVAAGL